MHNFNIYHNIKIYADLYYENLYCNKMAKIELYSGLLDYFRLVRGHAAVPDIVYSMGLIVRSIKSTRLLRPLCTGSGFYLEDREGDHR